ncbi:MAG TPA: universal stress protein [Propionibacteriaceae bacterium]|nr:universal stress protein [Propionibacteriaceae bacterium]
MTSARLWLDNQKDTHHGWQIMNGDELVVGVDGSPEARWAVLWAAREARLRSATLTLVHVRSSVRDDRATGVDAESEAEGLLSVRAAEASEFEPGITITPRLSTKDLTPPKGRGRSGSRRRCAYPEAAPRCA